MPAAEPIRTKTTDFKPGDRVRCYGSWNGTVIRTVDNFLGGFVVVDYDHDQGQVSVYLPYVQPLQTRRKTTR